jgi:hypothetical protein
MTKRKSTLTAADAMRQVMASGVKKTGDVVAAVKKQFGLDVSPAYVAQFRSVEKKRRRRRGRTQAATTGPARRTGRRTRAVSASSVLLAGVEFIKQAGSIEAAKEALAVIEEIKRL